MNASQVPRCRVHGTVLNPAGECTLCARRSDPNISTGLPVWALVLGGATALVALIGVVSLGYSYFFRDSAEAATGRTGPEVPADGRYRLYSTLPKRLSRRAHIEASYARRVASVQRAGGRATNATPSAAYYRLDAIQQITAVDPADGITAFEYQVNSLRIGTTSSDATTVLENAVVQVQPRPSGEAIITVAGERIDAAMGGTYEAFRTMTPVYLGLSEDERYDVTTRRAVGEHWPLSIENAALRRTLDLHLHMEGASVTGRVKFRSLALGLGELEVILNVSGARPRNIGMAGEVESYLTNSRELISVPVAAEGRRSSESTTTSRLRVRVPGDDRLVRLLDFEIIEVRRQTNTPLD